jgi:hypothetical protein
LILDVSEPTKPALIGSAPIVSDHVQVVNNFAYLDGISNGIILDVSIPAHPVERGHIAEGFSYYVVGSTVYAVTPTKIPQPDCGEQQLWIFDTSDPDNPRERSSLALPSKGSCAKHIRVANNLAFITDAVLGGLTIVDVSDPDQPVLRGSYGAFSSADLRVVDNRVYIAAGAEGLQIIDASNPTQPRLLSTYAPAQDTLDIQVVGNLAYIADGRNGLRIFDVVNPVFPLLRGSADTPGSANSIEVIGSLAYIADGDSGLLIFDVSNPANPHVVGSAETLGSAFELQVVNNIAYIAVYTTDGSDLQVIDVSQPSAPTLRGTIVVNPDKYLKSFQVVGNLLYLMSNISFQIFDLSNLDAPTRLSYSEILNAEHIQVANSFAYIHSFVLDVGRSDYLAILDVHDPAHPVWKGGFDTGAINDLKIIGNLLYASTNGGIGIYDIHDPGHPLPLGWRNDLPLSAYYNCGGLYMADDLIYIATCPGLTILRAHPDLFQTQTEITSAGGNLVTYDKSLSLGFPTGTVATTTTITYKGLFAPSQPPYAGRGTVRSFTLEARDINDSSIAQTAQPYTMAISYTDSALKSLGITDESSLNLAYWDGKAWKDLLPCAGCALDTQTNRLTVRTNRFAEFVLSGDRPAVFVPVMRR